MEYHDYLTPPPSYFVVKSVHGTKFLWTMRFVLVYKKVGVSHSSDFHQKRFSPVSLDGSEFCNTFLHFVLKTTTYLFHLALVALLTLVHSLFSA